MNKYLIETARHIYLDGGDKLVIQPDPDGLNCVEITLRDFHKELARITVPPYAAKNLANAINMLASELLANGPVQDDNR